MSMVSPLTYAVASGTKRLAIIGASLLILGNPVSSLNLLGMAVAAAGVLAYNKVSSLMMSYYIPSELSVGLMFYFLISSIFCSQNKVLFLPHNC